MIWPILSAILGIIAFLPLNIYPAAFIFLVPLFIFFIKEEKLWRLIVGTLLFRLIFGLGTVYFTFEPILWTLTLLLFLGLPVAIFLFKKFINKTNSILLTLIFLPLIWTFFDHLEAYFSFFPTHIATAGNALGSSPLVGLANFGGIIFLTFFITLINAWLVGIILNIEISFGSLYKINRKLLSLFFVIFFFFAWQISVFQLQQNSLFYKNLPNSIKIAAIAVNEKFNSNQFTQIKNELVDQSLNLIIFPENIFNREPNQSAFFQDLAKNLNTNILIATDTYQEQEKYKTALLFDNQGALVDFHHKKRLAFAGEYWPFGKWLPPWADWLKKNNPQYAGYALFDRERNSFTAGDQNLLSANFPSGQTLFATPICLEIHYPSDLKKYKENGAKFIINPTSNRWIDDFGTRHFLYLTGNFKKIEAVWLKLPIVSSGVRDFAGIILPDGQSQLVDYETENKNYGIFFGEIKY